MKSILLHSGLSVINGSEVKKVLQKENGLISLCVQATQLNHIKNCKTSLGAWNSLQAVFRPSCLAKKVYLFKQLLDARMKDDKKISKHFNKLSSITDKLAEIGIDMNGKLKTIVLLSNLPTQYEQLAVAMETIDGLPTAKF